jgi:hypothetical protein
MAFRLDTTAGLRQNLSMTTTNTQYLIQQASALSDEIGPKAWDDIRMWLVAILGHSVSESEWIEAVNRAANYAREFNDAQAQ